jgi:protocatechuate 4,5-dioxygenase beta chain
VAKIVGAITTSHVPLIGKAIALGLHDEPYWKPFFRGYQDVHRWIDRVQPDVAVVIYNDHGLNFFLDKMPAFAVGAAPVYHNADEGWGIPTLPPFAGHPDFSWRLIESLTADEFDLTTCQEMLVDHAFTLPMAMIWANKPKWPVRVIPVSVNTVQHPLPSASRCFRLGQSIGKAIEAYPEDLKVVVLGTGGMSHQLDGTRAGFINREFDLMFLEKLVDDPQALTQYTIPQLVQLAGTQGVELIMWLAARGALTGSVAKVHSNYHVPISNTATGLLVMQNS